MTPSAAPTSTPNVTPSVAPTSTPDPVPSTAPTNTPDASLNPSPATSESPAAIQTTKPDKVTVPNVAKVKVVKVTAGKKKLVLKWKKSSGVSGYQLQISTKKNFKGAKKISISKSRNKYAKKNLKSRKKYYIRIRAYKTYRNADKKKQKVYGKWTTKSKKIK